MLSVFLSSYLLKKLNVAHLCWYGNKSTEININRVLINFVLHETCDFKELLHLKLGKVENSGRETRELNCGNIKRGETENARRDKNEIYEKERKTELELRFPGQNQGLATSMLAGRISGQSTQHLRWTGGVGWSDLVRGRGGLMSVRERE
jgi:hypothetical protein